MMGGKSITLITKGKDCTKAARVYDRDSATKVPGTIPVQYDWRSDRAPTLVWSMAGIG